MLDLGLPTLDGFTYAFIALAAFLLDCRLRRPRRLGAKRRPCDELAPTPVGSDGSDSECEEWRVGTDQVTPVLSASMGDRLPFWHCIFPVFQSQLVSPDLSAGLALLRPRWTINRSATNVATATKATKLPYPKDVSRNPI